MSRNLIYGVLGAASSLLESCANSLAQHLPAEPSPEPYTEAPLPVARPVTLIPRLAANRWSIRDESGDFISPQGVKLVPAYLHIGDLRFRIDIIDWIYGRADVFNENGTKSYFVLGFPSNAYSQFLAEVALVYPVPEQVLPV